MFKKTLVLSCVLGVCMSAPLVSVAATQQPVAQNLTSFVDDTMAVDSANANNDDSVSSNDNDDMATDDSDDSNDDSDSGTDATE